MEKRKKMVIALMILTVLIIIVWGIFFAEGPYDFMSKDYKMTGWHIGHMLSYMVVGVLLPNQTPFVLAVGVGFEVFEYLLWTLVGSVKIGGRVLDYQDRKGNMKDVIFNMIGYWAGQSLSPIR